MKKQNIKGKLITGESARKFKFKQLNKITSFKNIRSHSQFDISLINDNDDMSFQESEQVEESKNKTKGRNQKVNNHVYSNSLSILDLNTIRSYDTENKDFIPA